MDIYVSTSSDNGVGDPYTGWALVTEDATSGKTYLFTPENKETWAKFKLALKTANDVVTPEVVSASLLCCETH